MALTGGNQLREVKVVVLHNCIGLVADMRVCLRQRCFSQITTIMEKGRDGGGDQTL